LDQKFFLSFFAKEKGKKKFVKVLLMDDEVTKLFFVIFGAKQE
jgi:hypothetical protein